MTVEYRLVRQSHEMRSQGLLTGVAVWYALQSRDTYFGPTWRTLPCALFEELTLGEQEEILRALKMPREKPPEMDDIERIAFYDQKQLPPK